MCGIYSQCIQSTWIVRRFFKVKLWRLFTTSVFDLMTIRYIIWHAHRYMIDIQTFWIPPSAFFMPLPAIAGDFLFSFLFFPRQGDWIVLSTSFEEHHVILSVAEPLHYCYTIFLRPRLKRYWRPSRRMLSSQVEFHDREAIQKTLLHRWYQSGKLLWSKPKSCERT